MDRQNGPAIRQLLHPFNPAAPPAVPVRRHPVLLQILAIEGAQYGIEDLGVSLAHAVGHEVRQVGAAAAAKGAGDVRGRLVELHVVLVFVRAWLEELDGRDPGGRRRSGGIIAAAGILVGGGGGGGGGDGLELTGHHARGHADPGRQYGARGASAVVAVVGGDHGERDLAIGEGVEGALGAGGDLDFVTDGATVAAAVEDQRVVWQHRSGGGGCLSSF